MKIKSSWNDITLNEFIQLTQILQSEIPEDYQLSNIVSVLTGRTLQEIENLPLSEYKKLTSQLEFLNTTPQRKETHSDCYEINGITYDLKADLSSLTTAQYIDYLNYSKEDPIDQTKILSCFLVPTNHSYNDGYSIEKTISELGNINILDYLTINFYLRLQSVAFTLILVDYLKNQLKTVKMSKSMRKTINQQIKVL
jgi:hypothetical protein